MNKKILCIASLLLLFIGQISADDHFWQFDEGRGNIAYDSDGGRGGRNAVNGILNNAQWKVVDDGYGVQISGADNSYVSFANPIGQFGTQDFTVALWFRTTDKSLALADFVGNRAAPGHGNFFAVRMSNDGYVSAEVDQDAAGTNYIGVRSNRNRYNDGNWHHVAVTRSGRTLTLYMDGIASNSGTGSGVANINNGLVFKIGRSLVDPNTPRFAPQALFDDLATYDSVLSASRIAELAKVDPDTRDHVWLFDEGAGNIAYDAVGGRNPVNGILNNAQWKVAGDGYGVQISGADNSYVSFANPIGQFGTQDFTVTFWLQTADKSLALADLVGNRAAPGHGNFFGVRLSSDGYVSAEVDQDAAGTNYIGVRSTQNRLNDGDWHHVAVTRSGRTLTLYIDGIASNSGTGAGVANINNRLVFKIGRSLVDRNTPRFAPQALFDVLATYDYALSADEIAEIVGVDPQPQPQTRDHLWQFDEGTGNIARDSQGGRNPVNGVLNNAQWIDLSKVGPGAAVRITGADNSFVSFGNDIGQFGRDDFTVAFWFQTTDTSLSLADLVGNRAAPGHGSFFAVRLSNDGYVSAEVDQDAAGTYYIGVRSNRNRLNDGNWHHVAVTRSGRTLTLYIDGAASNSGTANGVANINNNVVFKIGRSLVDRNTPRFALDSTFDDLAIYNSALSANQVNQLYANATNQ